MSTSGQGGNPVIGHVLIELDKNPGNITTRDQQDAFLEEFTSTYVCPYKSSRWVGLKDGTNHNATSLRQSLTGIATSHFKRGEDVRPGKKKVDELFERGSDVLNVLYVANAKGAARETALALNPRNTKIQERNAEDEEEDGQEGENPSVDEGAESDESYTEGKRVTRGAKKAKKNKRKATALSTAPPPPPASPVFKKPDLQGRKRTRKDSENSADRGVSPFSAPNKQPQDTKRKPSIDLFNTAHSDASGFESEDEDQDNDEDDDDRSFTGSNKRRKLSRDYAEEGILEEVKEDSTRLQRQNRQLARANPSGEDEDKREKASASSASHGTNETPIDSPRNSKSLNTTATEPRDDLPAVQDLASQVQELNLMIKSAVTRYLSNIPSSKSADVVVNPTQELEQLYVQVFGSSDWKATARDLQLRGRLPTAHLLRSLIAAFMTQEIFDEEESLSWLHPESTMLLRALTALSDQEGDLDWFSTQATTVTGAINRKLHDGSKEQNKLSSALGNLFGDEELTAEILKPEAKKMTLEFHLTLNRHLNMLNSGRTGLRSTARFHKDLNEAFELALGIQTRLVLEMTSQECVWHGPGTEYDQVNMDVELDIDDEEDEEGEYKDEVALTIFPAVGWKDMEDQRSVQSVVSLA